jgi:hypothetical protein
MSLSSGGRLQNVMYSGLGLTFSIPRLEYSSSQSVLKHIELHRVCPKVPKGRCLRYKSMECRLFHNPTTLNSLRTGHSGKSFVTNSDSKYTIREEIHHILFSLKESPVECSLLRTLASEMQLKDFGGGSPFCSLFSHIF